MSETEDKARAALVAYRTTFKGRTTAIPGLFIDDTLDALAPIFAELDGEIERLKRPTPDAAPESCACLLKGAPHRADCHLWQPMPRYAPNLSQRVAQLEAGAGQEAVKTLIGRLEDMARRIDRMGENFERLNERAGVVSRANYDKIEALEKEALQAFEDRRELERRYDLHHHTTRAWQEPGPPITSCPVDPPE